jgi:hypothetical protein
MYATHLLIGAFLPPAGAHHAPIFTTTHIARIQDRCPADDPETVIVDSGSCIRRYHRIFESGDIVQQ